jgi:hypothetical protein
MKFIVTFVIGFFADFPREVYSSPIRTVVRCRDIEAPDTAELETRINATSTELVKAENWTEKPTVISVTIFQKQ